MKMGSRGSLGRVLAPLWHQPGPKDEKVMKKSTSLSIPGHSFFKEKKTAIYEVKTLLLLKVPQLRLKSDYHSILRSLHIGD